VQVSKQPLQLFVDLVSGALRYAPVGPLPPNTVAISFYKTSDNVQGIVGPSSAFLSWPSTQGFIINSLYDAPWWLCPMDSTNQYKVFINNANWGLGGNQDDSSDVSKDAQRCQKESLTAINANPWKKGQPAPGY
jgi:hypothetical protein